MKRKLLAITLVLLMMTSLTMPALASDGADDVKAKLTELRGKYTSPAAIKAISDALSWLNVPENAATITSEQGTTIVSNIVAAATTVGSATTLGELTEAQRNAVIGNVNAAAGSLGWTVIIDSTGGGTSWVIRDADGNEVTAVSSGNVIKQTGIDSSLLIALIIGITILFSGAVVFTVATRKKRMVNEAA